jgi:hypothetical protein
MTEAFAAFLGEQGKSKWSASTLNERLAEGLKEAGIYPSATPDKTSKVRASDKESSHPDWNTGYRSSTGRVCRMWRGVRFSTRADDAADQLKSLAVF